MKQLTRIFACLVGLTIILISNNPAASKGDKKDDGKDLLAIEISMPGLKPLTVPVIAGKKSALLPLTGAKVSAVKVVPRLENGSVTFDVLAVLDPLPAERSCESVNKLKTELVTSYSGDSGKTFQISALEKFGVAPFSVRVIKMRSSSLECPPTCCCCGSVGCCPRGTRGGCLDCGDCGFCCYWP
jgi:hypothetical protein